MSDYDINVGYEDWLRQDAFREEPWESEEGYNAFQNEIEKMCTEY